MFRIRIWSILGLPDPSINKCLFLQICSNFLWLVIFEDWCKYTVPTVSNKQKAYFCCHLESHWRKSSIRIRFLNPMVRVRYSGSYQSVTDPEHWLKEYVRVLKERCTICTSAQGVPYIPSWPKMHRPVLEGMQKAALGMWKNYPWGSMHHRQWEESKGVRGVLSGKDIGRCRWMKDGV